MAFFWLFLLLSLPCHAFVKGFNQAWINDAYQYQWLNTSFDPAAAEHVLSINHSAGSKLLRMWLYEGADLRPFEVDERAQLVRIKPEVLTNLRSFLTLARQYQTQINITFLDANAYKNLAQHPQADFWNNVFGGGQQRRHFFAIAIAPIYDLIASEFSDVVTQIDLVNEVNALISYGVLKREKLAPFLCQFKSGSPVPTTASLGWHNAVDLYFQGIMRNSCVDFIDIHLYNDSGTIPRCDDFKRLARQGQRFQLGEFGQKSAVISNSIQTTITRNFLANAKRCGFAAALAWRLIDQRPFPSAQERFTYEHDGQLRPAFFTFQNADH